MRHSVGLIAHRFTKPKKSNCWSHQRALTRAKEPLLMSSLQVSSLASMSMSALVYIINTLSYDVSNFVVWSLTWLGQYSPLTVLDSLTFSWPLTLTFALTFDQKLKFQIGPILLSFSRRFRFWTPFLQLKLQNWSINTFFIVVSSKALFKASLSDLLMLIQPQVFIELPPWVWGRVLGIY